MSKLAYMRSQIEGFGTQPFTIADVAGAAFQKFSGGKYSLRAAMTGSDEVTGMIYDGLVKRARQVLNQDKCIYRNRATGATVRERRYISFSPSGKPGDSRWIDAIHADYATLEMHYKVRKKGSDASAKSTRAWGDAILAPCAPGANGASAKTMAAAFTREALQLAADDDEDDGI
jgi:hypothetical protein